MSIEVSEQEAGCLAADGPRDTTGGRLDKWTGQHSGKQRTNRDVGQSATE